jgi:hypothetical protein
MGRGMEAWVCRVSAAARMWVRGSVDAEWVNQMGWCVFKVFLRTAIGR